MRVSSSFKKKYCMQVSDRLVDAHLYSTVSTYRKDVKGRCKRMGYDASSRGRGSFFAPSIIKFFKILEQHLLYNMMSVKRTTPYSIKYWDVHFTLPIPLSQ